MTYNVGCVVLTMGKRPVELRAALDSLLVQENVSLDVVVVGNGWEPAGLPTGVRPIALPENLGIPAGRNAGVSHVQGEYLFFLDDDAALPHARSLSDLIDEIAQGDGIGLVQPRVIDPAGLQAPDRWVPRIKAGDHSQPGPATTLWEGCIVMRRDTFDEIGGWGDPYFYAHEGIELCWRFWNAGQRVWYAGNVPIHHPAINPERHAEFWYMNARNRVWLARRNLPVLLVAIYPLTWVLLTLGKVKNLKSLRSWFRGFFAGWTQNPGGRQPMKWRTVWALAKAGRPPIV